MGPLRHTVLAGFDYQRFDFNNFARFAAHQHARHPGAELHPEHPGPHGDIPEPGPAPAAKRGLYVQDEAKLGRLTVLGGIRYDWAEGSTLAQNLGTPPFRNDDREADRPHRCDLQFRQRDRALCQLLDLVPADQRRTRCSMASPSSRPPASRYEAGVKYQPARLQPDVSRRRVYDLKQQNVPTTISGPGIPPNTHRTGWRGHIARFRGIGGRKPLPGLSLRGQYSTISTTASPRAAGRQFRQGARQYADARPSLWANYAWCRPDCDYWLWLRRRRTLCPRHVHDRRQQPDRPHHPCPASSVPGQRDPVQHGVRRGALLRFRLARISSGRA